jgi:thiamine biosynthesis lipoprotein
MGAECERSFSLFGSEVRLLVGAPAGPTVPAPGIGAVAAEVVLRHVHERLTRFDPSSGLSRLNADPRTEVPVEPLIAAAVSAALWAAHRSGGLVDPTLHAAVEAAGYRESRAGRAPGPLGDAIAWAPLRRPARSAPEASWLHVEVDEERGIVRRPPGVLLDLGGSAKGWAADLAGARLREYETFAIDAGGDIRIGGARPAARVVGVDHPLREGEALALAIAEGAVATSGLRTRSWRHGDGFSHHLIDPATKLPAWTGVVQATALGRTALEAETLAKAALLAGPEEGRSLLETVGGLLILDDGEVVLAGEPPVARPSEVAA